uniref:(northern house mosquito) hypothetical protein n=1 Tax=Culex pipiens TaxID=7175 RepID=A0A8D8CRP9_CULPI
MEPVHGVHHRPLPEPLPGVLRSSREAGETPDQTQTNGQTWENRCNHRKVATEDHWLVRTTVAQTAGTRWSNHHSSHHRSNSHQCSQINRDHREATRVTTQTNHHRSTNNNHHLNQPQASTHSPVYRPRHLPPSWNISTRCVKHCLPSTAGDVSTSTRTPSGMSQLHRNRPKMRSNRSSTTERNCGKRTCATVVNHRSNQRRRFRGARKVTTAVPGA